MKIRNFFKPMLMTLLCCGIMPSCGMAQESKQEQAGQTPVPGKDGNKYVPYEQRNGNESISTSRAT